MSFKQLGKNVGVIQWPHILLYMTIHESDINPWMRKNRGRQPKKSLRPLRNGERCFVKESVQKMIRMSVREPMCRDQLGSGRGGSKGHSLEWANAFEKGQRESFKGPQGGE